MKYPELVEVFRIFYDEAIESMLQKRLPKYDFLHKTFDDALYNGRDRSERIIFDWLTPEERATAMTEETKTIESVIFPHENIHERSSRIARSLDKLNLLKPFRKYKLK